MANKFKKYAWTSNTIQKVCMKIEYNSKSMHENQRQFQKYSLKSNRIPKECITNKWNSMRMHDKK